MVKKKERKSNDSDPSRLLKYNKSMIMICGPFFNKKNEDHTGQWL